MINKKNKITSVLIFGRKDCDYCKNAIRLASQLIVSGDVDSITYTDIERESISKHDLSSLAGVEVKTVPQIFILDILDNKEESIEYIGGYTEFKEKFNPKEELNFEELEL